MSSSNHKHDEFLFASLDSRKPPTARKVHIRRLYDVLQLCIHRNDLERASRAWSVLARCATTDEEHRTAKRLDYLRTMMLRHQDDREHILRELIIQMIQSDRHREALDELELYLPSFPYQDNPILHIYAGLLCLYLAQPTTPNNPFNAALLRDAQSHFEHAQSVDPKNVVAKGFLDKIPALFDTSLGRQEAELDSEDEDSMVLDDSPRRKRART